MRDQKRHKPLQRFNDSSRRIPIFGSCPTDINDRQFEIKKLILSELSQMDLEWRSLGQTDYPEKFPLREVLTLAKHCSGGLILGFSQFETEVGTWKKGTPRRFIQKGPIAFTTPWNQLEAGVLFSLGIPLLIFRDKHISGGIFDNGVTDVFIHEMPKVKLSVKEKGAIREIFRKWAVKVHAHYYEES